MPANSAAVPVRSLSWIALSLPIEASCGALNKLRWQRETIARGGLAVLGGMLLAAAFPKLGVAGLAWVAPAVILGSALGTGGKRAFRLGCLAGFTHYLISLYWLLYIPVIKIAPIAAWLGLSGFLSLYTGLWVWLCWRIHPAAIRPHPGPVTEIFDQFLTAAWAQRLVWALSCAALWVAWEMAQARFLSGFPWNFLGASQYRMLPIIQIASVTGVYGVSFLAAWFAISVLCATILVTRRSHQTRRWMGDLALPLLAVIAVLWSSLRLIVPHPAAPETASIKVALVQPSIPQQWIWAPEESARRFQQLLELSRQALAEHPNLMVWPEAAVPGYLRWDTNLYAPIVKLLAGGQTTLILGADDAVPRRDPTDPDAADTFNSAFLMDPRDGLRGTYRKRRLVIFGEFLPFHRWLPFLERWTGLGSFTAGDKPVSFDFRDPPARASMLICFEDVFPHVTRDSVDEETDFLLNLTNNGWFGESAAQWQHAASAVFRAIENGVPLVRCANNGLTCWVDPQGRMHEVFFPGTTDIYGPGIKTVRVPILAGKKRSPTFYGKHGDLFGWACVGWTIFVVAAAVVRGRGLSRRNEETAEAEGETKD